MSNFALYPLLLATWQTIYMVFIASFVSIIIGLWVGVVLFLAQKKQAFDHKALRSGLGFIVNIGRSIPFIILLVALIPFTRWIVGTSIGTNAAMIPLIIAAIPFYARIVEAALEEVPSGLIEAANAMGATTWQQVRRFLLPEALPSLIKGATLTVIGLVGYSAMAGAVGGGGLGELAINYGYQRFNVWVMLETVVILVVIVQWVQSVGDHLARVRKVKGLSIMACVFLVVCIVVQLWPAAAKAKDTLRIGIMSGVQQKIMAVAKKVAWNKYHLNLDLVVFNDYVQPNIALNNGDINANIFQHVPYLDAQIKTRGFKISPIAKTFVYPMGFYSRKIHHLSQLKEDAIVAIPNDPSNEGRALLLLQKAHLISLNPRAGLFATPKNIIKNPLHLQFKELGDAQLPRVLKDATLVALTNDYVGPAGFSVKQAILREGADSPYANVIAVRTSRKNNPLFLQLVGAMHSKAVVHATMRAFPEGAAIAAWK
jgi:D-methionine transport system permease protein